LSYSFFPIKFHIVGDAAKTPRQHFDCGLKMVFGSMLACMLTVDLLLGVVVWRIWIAIVGS
jgi:cytochrome b subunit of formate dehydrogenase